MFASSQKRSTRSEVAGLRVRKSLGAALLVAMLSAAPVAARPDAPFAANGDRMAVKTAFKRYLSLLNAGDASAANYLTPDFSIIVPDGANFERTLRAPSASASELVPIEILLDDGGTQLAAELELRPIGKLWRPGVIGPRRTVFYTLRQGRLAAARVALDGSQFIRAGTGMPDRAAPAARTTTFPATVTQPYMTRAKFEDYMKLFGRFDEHFVRYYHPEIVFGISPAPSPLHGREEVLALYRPLRRTLDEDVTIHSLVIDSERGLMAAEISNHMKATGPVRIGSMRMDTGDRRVASGVIFYGLKDGMIISLR